MSHELCLMIVVDDFVAQVIQTLSELSLLCVLAHARQSVRVARQLFTGSHHISFLMIFLNCALSLIVICCCGSLHVR
jgi:hypothetical protein